VAQKHASIFEMIQTAKEDELSVLAELHQAPQEQVYKRPLPLLLSKRIVAELANRCKQITQDRSLVAQHVDFGHHPGTDRQR
jgi:hypothetical protein